MREYNKNHKPASLSMRFRSSGGFMARSLLGVRLQTRIEESAKPAANRLESSHTSTDVTL